MYGNLQQCKISDQAVIMNIRVLGSTNRGFDFTVGSQNSHLTINYNDIKYL